MKKRESNIPVHRIHLIDEEIRRGTYPNKKILAKKLEVSERTIFRDLEFLRNFYNAPMEFDAVRNGFYYTDPDFYVKSVTLSEGELFSISLFDKLLSQYKNTPLEKKLKSIFEKIALFETTLAKVVSISDKLEQAKGFKDVILPAMEALRADVDAAESITAAEYWPYPSYGDILFSVQ